VSTYVGRIHLCSDVPGVAIKVREQAPHDVECTVFVDGDGGVFFLPGNVWQGSVMRAWQGAGAWTASELAEALLANVRKRGLV
jgi:hypothetical protein